LSSKVERRFVEEEFKMSEIEKWATKEVKNLRNEF
jgi:serine/threonine-protein kinase RIO1